MNELPKVFVNKIDKEIKNYQEESRITNKIDFDDILSDDKYSFNHIYLITLNDNTQIQDSIIGKKDNKILTIDNNYIDINNIKNIIEIKK